MKDTSGQSKEEQMIKNTIERKTKRKPERKTPIKGEIGRPTRYTNQLADEICAQLAEGLSLRKVCERTTMPGRTTVFSWLRKKPDFRNQYEYAKEESADALFEELLDIADDGKNDWMQKRSNNGDCIGWQVNGENIQRSRLRVDARKWMMSKMKPKKYGDRQQHDIGKSFSIEDYVREKRTKRLGSVTSHNK